MTDEETQYARLCNDFFNAHSEMPRLQEVWDILCDFLFEKQVAVSLANLEFAFKAKRTAIDDNAALEAFKDAFERHKKDGLFKGLDELHRVWGQLSETGSHANIAALVDRFVQVTDEKHVTFKLNYTGVESERIWRQSIFGMLLTCSTMLFTFLSDYDGRLKLDDTLMRMREECNQFKEQVREWLKVRYKIEPPRGIHPAPKPTIYRP